MIIKDIPVYDGELLHSRFAYKFFREKTLPIGNIIAFRSPMLVEAEGMIDTEDIIKNEFIYSDDAINYVRYLYVKDITKLIKVPQEIWRDDANIDFKNKDTKLVIASI